MPGRILFIDDEMALVSALTRYFDRLGFESVGAYMIGEATGMIEASLREQKPFAAIVTDLQLPDGDGRSIVKLAREKMPHCPVLVMTGSGSVSGSVEALRLGALTVLEKPVPLDRMEAEVRAAIADEPSVAGGLEAAAAAGIIGNSPQIKDALGVLLLAAPTDATVLIEGETGTGKELVAQALHRLSRRARGPMVTVNCAALPENLLESELFGHARGAFTGAFEARQGKFRQADKGTIFLDEIGEMPLGLQAKLLRVLQEKEVQPLGLDKPMSVDVRVVAATNRDVGRTVGEGKFRADLFYRLNVVPLKLPPLRERREDVQALAQHFAKKRGRRFTEAALQALQQHDWPGNVRELENLVERLTVLRPSGELDAGDLPFKSTATAAAQAQGALPAGGIDLYAALGELEDRLIREALDRSQGNKAQAAEILGLNRTTLVEKLKKMSRQRDR